jgi:sarcosine oxidase
VTDRIRVVVVGGGVMGAAAAWRLASRGATVTLLEQFAPGHDRGASHGSSRIFRLAYAEAEYVELARRSHDRWRELEQATGTELLTITGAVDHGDPAALDAIRSALDAADAEATAISAGEAERRWPGLRIDGAALWHALAGRLHADRAVAALKAAAHGLGAEIRHDTPVAAVNPERRTVTTVAGEVVAADGIVVAAGGWSRRLLGGLADLPPLRVTVEQPAHFAPRHPATPWPSFIHHPGAAFSGPGGAAAYGLGSDDGVKVGFHKVGPEVSPDEAGGPIDGDRLAALQEYVRAWVPGVDPDSAEPLTCTYTLTPDEHFVVDRNGPVTVLAGFSGHGFKFAPAIGDLAAGLALGDGSGVSPTFAFGPRPDGGDAQPVIR